MTNKTTSAIDLVERVAVFLSAFKADPFSTGADKAERLIEIVGNGSADTITRLQAALEAVKAYYIDANPTKLTEAYVCDLVCEALRSSVGGE